MVEMHSPITSRHQCIMLHIDAEKVCDGQLVLVNRAAQVTAIECALSNGTERFAGKHFLTVNHY